MMLDESHLEEGIETSTYKILHFLLTHGFMGDFSKSPILRPDTNHMVRWTKDFCEKHAGTTSPQRYLR